MKILRRDLPYVLIPPAIAALLILGYFLVSDRWLRLENPIAGTLAIVFGVFGAIEGLAFERLRQWRLEAVCFLGLAFMIVWWFTAAQTGTNQREVLRWLIGIDVVLMLLLPLADAVRTLPPPGGSRR